MQGIALVLAAAVMSATLAASASGAQVESASSCAAPGVDALVITAPAKITYGRHHVRRCIVAYAVAENFASNGFDWHHVPRRLRVVENGRGYEVNAGVWTLSTAHDDEGVVQTPELEVTARQGRDEVSFTVAD